MFVANSVAYAARVCIAELAGQERGMAGASAASDVEHQCPSADDAGLCLTHCTQGFKSEQTVSPEVPGLILAPVLFVSYAWVEAGPTTPVVAPAPQVVGPPLTILFRNFRN